MQQKVGYKNIPHLSQNEIIHSTKKTHKKNYSNEGRRDGDEQNFEAHRFGTKFDIIRIRLIPCKGS